VEGFTWATAIWGITLLVFARRKSWLKLDLSREHIAVVLLLASTHSLSTQSAEDVLSDPVNSERAIRGLLVGAALLIVIPLIVKRWRAGSQPAGKALFGFGIYVTVGAASLLYSPAPVVTMGKVFEVGVALIVFAALFMRRDASSALRSAITLVVLLETALIAVAIVGYFALPGIFQLTGGRPGFLSGPTLKSPYSHFNHISASSAMVFAYALTALLSVRERRTQYWWAGLAAVGTGGMLLSAGRQGLVIFLASAVVSLFFLRRHLFLILIAPLSAIVIAANWDVLFEIFRRGQAESTFNSWSGRLNWWAGALDVWKTHPWTGYGFGAGGRYVALASLDVSASSLHSGYMEALVGVGILGLVPLFYVIFRVSSWALKNLHNQTNATEAILIVPLLLHTMVSLGFGAWLVADVLLFLGLAAMSDVADRRSPVLTPQPITADAADGFS
jgi:O-antigen ligase